MKINTRLWLAVGVIGACFAVLLAVTSYVAGYNNTNEVLTGYVFGVVAMGTVAMYDDYLSRSSAAGGK